MKNLFKTIKRKFNLIKRRWKSKSPIFFKRITNFFAIIAGMVTAGWAASSAMGWDMPIFFENVMGYTLFVSSAIAVLAKLTTDDPDLSKED